MESDGIQQALELIEMYQRRERFWFIFKTFFTPKQQIETAREQGFGEIADKMEARRQYEISRNPQLYRKLVEDIRAIDEKLRQRVGA